MSVRNTADSFVPTNEFGFSQSELDLFGATLVWEIINQKDVVSHVYQPPQILDLSVSDDRMKFTNIISDTENKITPEISQYSAAREELLELNEVFLSVMEKLQISKDSDAKSIAIAVKNTFGQFEGLSSEGFEALVSQMDTSGIFTDYATLANSVLTATAKLEEDARWIYYPNEKRIIKYLGIHAHRALSMSRMFALVPFEAIQRLRETQFVVAGASVAASTIDMLVSLGAENIIMGDAGKLAPSNIPRMPAGSTGSLLSLGEFKAQTLASNLSLRNPYGKFDPFSGFVLVDEKDRVQDADRMLGDIIKQQDPQNVKVIEVVDDAATKVKIRNYLKENYPEISVFFIGDVGNNPFAGIEDPLMGDFFNQAFSDNQRVFLDNVAHNGASPIEKLQAVILMVGDSLPSEHKVQLLFVALGLVPYFSQTPIASRLSSSFAGILALSSDQPQVTGTNRSLQDVPTTLFPGLSKSAVADLFNNVLRLPQ